LLQRRRAQSIMPRMPADDGGADGPWQRGGRAALAEVHASNMSKEPVPAAGGEAVKGPRYRPPDIERVLAAGAGSAAPETSGRC
jgi:hypothetical protein